MSRQAIWTVEYDGPVADLSGAGQGRRRVAGTARRRVEVWASSAAEALARAPRLVGGSRHRVVGRAL
jgi:hypothetical protein